MRPPTSPATVATATTTARFRCPWLAATAAAPSAVAPRKGTPAHDAATARNRSRYCHQVSTATPAVATTIATTIAPNPWLDTGVTEVPGTHRSGEGLVALGSGAPDPASSAIPRMATIRPRKAELECP